VSLPIRKLLTQTLYYKEESSVDNAGDPTFGTLQNMKCRAEREVREILDRDGNTLVGSWVVATLYEVPRNAQVWLPGDNTSDATAARRRLGAVSAQTPDGFELWETVISASGVEP
jgi:hypothetical protein